MPTVKKDRCAKHSCNKRIKSLIIIECKCGSKFCCTNHMIPYQDHDCDYDFASEDKKIMYSRITTAFTPENTKLTRI